jgi:TetR/AcrR family transcriptional regulator
MVNMSMDAKVDAKSASSKTKKGGRRGKGRPNDPRKLVGRDAIVQAAREFLKTNAPSSVNRIAIARFAGVDPALIRYYFGTTDALLTAVATEISAEMHDRIHAAVAVGASTQQKLANRIAAFLAMHAENPHLNQLIVQQILRGTGEKARHARSAMIEDSVGTLKKILDEGASRNELRPVDARLLHIALIGMCDFFFTGRPVVEKLFGTGADDRKLIDSYGEFLVSLIISGLTKGPKLKK